VRNKIYRLVLLLALSGLLTEAATVQFNYSSGPSLSTLSATGVGSFSFPDVVPAPNSVLRIHLDGLSAFSFQVTTSPAVGGVSSIYNFGLDSLQSLTFYLEVTTSGFIPSAPVLTSSAVSSATPGAGIATLDFLGTQTPFGILSNRINYSTGQQSVGTINVTSFTNATPEPATASLLLLTGVISALAVCQKKNRWWSRSR
jgi:hypothetical protein